jgi:hypothetical protein
MCGRGAIGSVPPIDPRDKMYMLRNGLWQPMSEPINPDRRIFVERDTDFRSGVSLAASFAECYADNFDRKIGLIPCADGGTRLAQWQPDAILFDHAVMMTKLALRTSKLRGVLWHQGESDAADMDTVKTYEARFFTMYDALTDALGVRVPFILGEITELLPQRWPYAGELNDVLRDIASKRDDLGIVSAAGLTIGPDGIHFSGASYREFGRRYFAEYERVRRRMEATE